MKNHFDMAMMLRRLLIISLFILVLFITGFGVSCQSQAPVTSPPAPSAGSSEEPTSEASPGIKVVIDGFAFKPVQLNISVGASVTWHNSDSTIHTVTARDSSFDSGSLPSGATVTYTFKESGTFEYYCRFHSSMIGKIVVK